MSKLYVFGIGGTGARVLKSLTMLLAVGVKLGANEVVPIIIDPDFSCADLTRTIDQMKRYKKIREAISTTLTDANKNRFFKTLVNIDNVSLTLTETRDRSFRDYIGYSHMQNDELKSNYALTSMLFSDKNLNSNMNVGFKGNPNIGSVVLNQFLQSDEFMNFASSFEDGDSIFVVSSIFGGTGASGFPLLVKNLRNLPDTIPNHNLIKNAVIGALSVLPYFRVSKDESSEIDSSSFISKTKAALSYYDRNLNEVNVVYYISDNLTKEYDNSEGGTQQKNAAHFVELASALSIIDFSFMSRDNLVVINGVPQEITYKEFGVNDQVENLIFNNLSEEVNSMVQRKMLQYQLFVKYIKNQISDSAEKQTWSKDSGLGRDFITSNFFQSTLNDFNMNYLEWLREMSTNRRGFSPFSDEDEKKGLFHIMSGVDPKKLGFFGLGKDNYTLFDDSLNTEVQNVSKLLNQESKFFELFYRATDSLINKKFNVK
ncbi:hypothetical protein [Ornithobacterium rhinotracheale]|uniref:Uncharacterized protein n=2 Tax=Ornithobacterium rhinotracheale TaxID=28251 RepID=I3ZZX1_ORNRL|nr:hypothetical protein [Ornithobacterium rhinotracheale]AFL97255.1 hypothetical protein Ornrh_1064 [Ornithobacterium rhinotracheale DSM 15997]MCK0199722.1 hypothetical protein [Ornithobacterium rhinotracheale]UOH64328.1 hypothetical protein MT993_03720 [Ornithobacterium rhinotracheale]UOH65705.1 hypothetical protein MT999_10995 [Ornithobacterium rhinotracheale]UVD86175.1 hypothetical protein NV236_05665 [Ornithobacterium rhinotracheale]